MNQTQPQTVERMSLDCAMSMVEHAPEQAAWLREQRRELRLGMLADEKRAYLDDKVPGWDSVALDLALGL